MKRFLALIAALTLPVLAYHADALGFSFESVTFPNEQTSPILNIAVTRRGHLWAGSKECLMRMDHNTFTKYTADGNPGSIPGDNILSLNVDEEDRLWVRTDKGVAIYDADNDAFHTLQMDIDGIMTNIVIYSSMDLGDGVLLGGENVLYYYDKRTSVISVKKALNIIPSFSIDDILTLSNERIVLYDQNNGFIEYRIETNSIDKCPIEEQAVNSRCFFVDSKGRFWRSVFNEGLECYDPYGGKISTFTKENSGINCNIINCIIERDGLIWVGTEVGGINIINPETREIVICMKEEDNPNSFPCNCVRSMFCDKNGNVWVVRGKGGIELLRYSYCRSFYVSPAAETSGSVSLAVTSLLTDYGSDNLYIATATNGIYSIERKGSQINYKKIISYPATHGYAIESMALLPDLRIMAVVMGEGMYVLNPKDGSFRPVDRADKRIEDYIRTNGTGRRTTVHNDSDGNILIFTNNVFLFEPKSMKLTYIDYNVNMSESPMYSVNGKKNDLFHESRYIYKWDSDNRTFSVLLDIGENIINCATMDNSEQLWLATEKGLCWVSRDFKSREFIETKLFKKASAINCDDIGRIFIGAEGKMCVYLPASGEFTTLGTSDGLRANNYDPGAVDTYFSEQADRLFFGGNEGVAFIDTDIDIHLNKTPHIVLASLALDGNRLSDFTDVKLPVSYKDLHVKIVSADDDILSSKKYSFQITGPQHRIDVAESTAGSISVRYKAAGTYHVSAAVLLDNGEWSEYQDIVSFTVDSPFYRKIWFLTLCAVLTAALIFIIARISKK